MKALGLRREITSPERFASEVEKGYMKALDMLRENPTASFDAKTLRAIHTTIFENVLESTGKLRVDDTPFREVMEKRFQEVADKSSQILQMPSESKKVDRMAELTASILKERPFQDGAHGFVNRTVGLVALESQLEHNFGRRISLEIDAKALETAVDRSSRDQSTSRELRDSVRDMTGGKANVIDLEKFRGR